ncbi:S8 family peptidase [Actinoplanes sp. NPDC049596]|uniref:S8 family peptidase n=1 Tax=unclassified Actinoplanes TaxID=2626549 RepID=UPI00342FC837
MLRRTRRTLAAALIAAGLGAVPATPGLAAPTTDSAAGALTVTLLTGDVVTVNPAIPGCGGVRVRPAGRHGAILRRCDPDGHVHIVPSSVAGQIGTLYDEDLFDVTTLIANGYDDARSPDLPVIIKPAGNAKLTGRPLPSIGAVATRLPKQSLAGQSSASQPSNASGPGPSSRRSGAAVPSDSATPQPGASGQDAASKPGASQQGVASPSGVVGHGNASQPGLAAVGGAAKIWLDHRVRATPIAGSGRLDTNLTQIAADQAWRAGYTGRGVKLAVLDTGADFTHPDLVGRVAEKADFVTEGGDAVDGNGHGTHVATTAAGSGKASGGARRGVAPDAQLLIGKVLDDGGYGSDSQVIAGMEWAAARADVVSMSLGDSSAGEDGPLTQAVDELTAATGALFVVAAGNAGPGPGTVASPGTAAAALTVGAVDSRDRIAGFSSRGPLAEAHTAKPEVTAPGVDIVAGRAEGTTLGAPIDADYVSLSGTSMATPHVAGEVALVKQRHPDWSADRLKAAVIGSADPLPGVDTYTGGAGRVNAARALGPVVSEQPVIALGADGIEAKLSWSGPVKRWDVTTYDRSGRAVAGRPVTLSGTRLRLDRAALKRTGFYSAVVTVNGGAARTVVTFEIPAPRHTLTVRTRPMPDAYPGGTTVVVVNLVNEDDPAVKAVGASGEPGGTVTFGDVPAGRYAMETMYFSNDATYDNQRVAYLSEEVSVTGDLSRTVDPATAKLADAAVDGVRTRTDEAAVSVFRTSANGIAWGSQLSVYGPDPVRLSIGTIGRPATGSQRLYTSYSLVDPDRRSHFDLISAHPKGMPAGESLRVSRAGLARIDQRADVMTFPYEVVPTMRRYGYTPDGEYLSHSFGELRPEGRTDYVTPGYLWQDEGRFSQLGQERLVSYAAGSRTEKHWGRQPVHADWFDDPAVGEWGCATAPARTSGTLHLDMTTQTERHDRADCLAAGSILFTRSMSLYRNGELVGTTAESRADFDVPRERAGYRLKFDVDMSRIQSVSTKTSTTWGFRSTGPTGLNTVALPLLAVDYDLALDHFNHATGRPATFTVRQSRTLKPQRITSFTVRTSVDDGVTWRPVPVRGFQATLPPPPAGGFLSLRVTATGDGGSSIDQTIMRAYASR